MNAFCVSGINFYTQNKVRGADFHTTGIVLKFPL